MMWHTASLHYLAANSVRNEEVKNQQEVWQKKNTILKNENKISVCLGFFLIVVQAWVTFRCILPSLSL